mmetsp:Transcript_110351/g.321352  ORF Transcript_110351/g.321352 Transcript_110351/m.321352 type:complete len:222 (+) Transcript_110351:145-810(+)
MTMEPFTIKVFDRAPIKEYLTTIRLIPVLEQRHHARLAAARGPTERHNLAGPHGQIQSVEHHPVAPRRVAEDHVAKHELAAAHRRHQASVLRGRRNLGLALDPLIDLVGRAHRLHQADVDRSHRVERREERLHVEHERDELARAEPVVLYELAAVVKHEARGAVGQERVRDGREGEVDERRALAQALVFLQVLAEARRELVLGVKGLDSAHGAQRLLGRGR